MKNGFVILMMCIAACLFIVGCAGGPDIPPGPIGEISEPRNVSLYLTTDSLEIDWEEPEENPGEIDQYRIILKTTDSSSMDVEEEIPSTQTFYKHEDFSSDTTYEFEILPLAKEPQKFTTKSASILSTEKENVYVLFRGTIFDGENNSNAVADCSLSSGEKTARTDFNGAFQIYVPRTAESIILDHSDFRKTTIGKDALEQLYSKDELYMPFDSLVLLIQPIKVEKEVIAEEGATATDESGDVEVTVEPDSFDSDVQLSLSSAESEEVEEGTKGLKNISLNITDSNGDDAVFKKPVSININFGTSSSSIPTRMYPSFVEQTPKMGDAIRAVLKEADLDFYIIQTKKDGEKSTAKGEFDKDTMNSTILADSNGVFSLIPDISIPVSIAKSNMSTETSSRDSGLNCSVDLDIDVFSSELIKKYFGGILTANFEFEVYEKTKDSEILVSKKVLQRSYLGVDNIRPTFDMASLNDVRTGYVNDSSAKKDTGYEFFVDTNTATLITETSQSIPNDDTLSEFFSKVENVTLMEQMGENKTYIVQMQFRLATPFGRITNRFNIGSFTSEGKEEKPPIASKITKAITTDDSIYIEWEECPDEDFDHYNIHIKKAGTLLPWRNIIEVTQKDQNKATITADIYNHLGQNSDYSLQIYTYDTASLYSIGEATSTKTKNKAPERINLFLADEVNAITSGSVLLSWQVSNEPDYEQYVIYYKEQTEQAEERWTSEASKTEINIRAVSSTRIENLKADTPYQIGIAVFDTAGASSALSEISVTTDDFTPPTAPEIKKTMVTEKVNNQYEFTIYWRDLSASEEGYRITCDATDKTWEQPKNAYKFVETMNATPGYTYTFNVIAYNGSFTGETQCEIQVPEKIPEPATPTISLVSKTSNTLTVQWPLDETVTVYRVYISLDGFSWILKNSITANQTQLTSLKPSTTYYVKVRAVNDGGTSEDIEQFTTEEPPAFTGPSVLNAKSVSYNAVQLEWNQTADTLAYYIYRKDFGQEKMNMVGYSPNTKFTFTDTNVSPESTYTYEVRAYNPERGGESENNATRTVVTPKTPSPPAKPKWIALEHVEDDSDYGYIQLLWEKGDETKVEEYLIQKKVQRQNQGEYTQLIKTTDPQYQDTSLTPQATYSYQLKAGNNRGNSEWSVESTPVYIAAKNIPPSAPALISPANNAENVQVNCSFVWSQSTDPNNDFSYYLLTINNATEVKIEGINNTAYATKLAYETDYSWKVTAVDEHASSTQSEEWSFNTKPKDVKLIYGQMSSLSLTPGSTGTVDLIVQNAKGLIQIILDLSYTDLLENMELLSPVNTSQGRYNFVSDVATITLDSSLTTDDATTIATFEVKASSGEGETNIIISPSSTFTDAEGARMNHNISPGKVTVKRPKTGLVSISQEKSRIMMGESLGINLEFSDISECATAVVKIRKNQSVSDYDNTNWQFLEGVKVATQTTDEFIILTLSASDTSQFDLTGNHQLRFLPEIADVNYQFSLDSVLIYPSTGQELSSACYGFANTYCENQSLKLVETQAELMQGETLFILVELSKAATINQLQFNINYDSDIFEFKAVNFSNDYSTMTAATSVGNIRCTLETAENEFIHEGDIIEFELKAIKPGKGFVQINNPEATYCVDNSKEMLFNPTDSINSEGKEFIVNSSDPEVILDDVQTTLGATYTIDFHITSIEDLKSFDIFLDYDPELSASPTVAFSDKLSDFHSIINIEEDRYGSELRITAAASASVDITGESLFSVEFTANKTGAGNVMIDPKTKLWDSTGNPININLDDTSRILVQ